MYRQVYTAINTLYITLCIDNRKSLYILLFQIVSVEAMKRKGKATNVTPSVPDGSEVTVSLIIPQG